MRLNVHVVLVIPIRLIWQIRVGWEKKVTLSFCFCLTIIIIIVSIVRASGIVYKEMLDAIWEVYWIVIAAEVGLILTSTTAFRTLFVARVRDRQEQQDETSWTWYKESKQSFKRLLSRLFSKSTGTQSSTGDEKVGRKGHFLIGGFPRATMTGIKTLINEVGQTRAKGTGTLHSTALTEEDEDSWPFRDRALDLSANTSRFGR